MFRIKLTLVVEFNASLPEKSVQREEALFAWFGSLELGDGVVLCTVYCVGQRVIGFVETCLSGSRQRG